jgi:hypothetical protein
MHSAGSRVGVQARLVRLLAGAAGGAALAVTMGAASAPSARPAGVTSYPAELLGVSAQSATDAWAVGESFH